MWFRAGPGLSLSRLLGIPLLWLLLFAPAAEAGEKHQSFALIVAHNRSLDPSIRPLRFADDDGARFYELVSLFADRVHLLAVLDPETQRTYPQLAKLTEPPSRAALRAAMDELRRAISRARKQGARTALYFYFAGHGDVGADREGYINLLDGRFSRTDLYREIIARSPAHVNHIIIDACNSYFLVNSRGRGRRGRRRASAKEAIRSFLAADSLDRYPQTGVLLSTASVAETHEWSRYRSGIFSHQLLSALWGGADVNGDGRVDYGEVGAYVAAANMRVRDSRARLSLFTRPPRSDLAAPLVNLKALERGQGGGDRPTRARIGAFLHVPRQMRGHYYLEDDRGVRYLDFNKLTEQPIRLALLARPYYYLRSSTHEAMIRVGQAKEIDAGALAFSPLATQSRGAVEESFRQHLYAYPFGLGFAEGYRTAQHGTVRTSPSPRLDVTEDPRPWFARLSTWKWAMVGVGAAGLAAGITTQILASQSADKLRAGAGELSMSEAVELQDQSNSRQTIASLSFGIAGTASVAALLMFLLDQPTSSPPSRGSRVALHPSGVSFSSSF